MISQMAQAGQTVFSTFTRALLTCLHYCEDVSPQELFAEHIAYAKRFEPTAPTQRLLPASTDPLKRLRVGYVSPDFRLHAVAYFFEPVLAGHDRKNVEIFCYHTTTTNAQTNTGADKEPTENGNQ